MDNLLIIKKIRPERLCDEVTFIFDRLEVEKRVANQGTVFVKPNIFSREPSDTGATTDMQLLGIVLDYFAQRGKRVLVGEAGANQFAQTRMFVELGLGQFCREHGAEFLDLNECSSGAIELKIRGGKYSFQAPLPLLEPHFLVNLPKFKTHLSTRVSWAIKNLYGLLPDKEKWLGHKIGIHETLVALNQRFPVQVVLMDGIVAMKGLGPTMGLPEEKNLLFGARDQFVHDLGLLRLLDIPGVPHIENCADGRPLDIEYQFLNEDGIAVDHKSLGIELRLAPLPVNRFFCKSNQVFFTLAPRLERFMNPKDILNLMGHAKFVGLVRGVQKILKI
jgi:uncharacterized protein (DUF362 family)